MSIGRISMHTTYARIDMQSTRPVVNMRQQHAQVEIHSELPRVIIDQTECFNTSGLKRNTELSNQFASDGYQNFIEYVQTTAEDGDTLAAIQNPGNPLIDIAERNATTQHEYDIDCIPKARPKIDVTGSLSIAFNPRDLGSTNGVQFDVRLGSLETKYIPGSLTIDYRL